MLVYNDETGELVGHWKDISPGGFRLETLKPIPQNLVFRFRIELSNDIANKSSMIFGARSRWCKQDDFDPNLYDVGFQIARLSPDDSRIFQSMFERYGSQDINANSTNNFFWR
jgi:hypothetical protein